jgi:DNA repair exonuclease SbcCD nuclease subunit
MRFVHISDTHLGFRQYGLHERELDFYHAFEDAVRKIIQLRPDFVVHSGDLFDFHRPQPRALWVAHRCFSKLKEKGIPVYAITGNHDTLLRRGAMPPHVLFSGLGLRLITEAEPFAVHRGVFIGGSPYVSKYYASGLRETLSILAKQSGKYRRSVLVLHQGIDKYLPHEYELKIGEVPKNFDYYALGHTHFRMVADFGKGKLAYPGSTEFWSLNEYEDLKKNGKGFFVVDLDGDEPTVQPVNVELSREIVKERVSAARLDEHLGKLKRLFANMSAKPLVYLDVDSKGYDRKALHEKLISQLSDITLSLRVSYALGVGKDESARVLARTFNIPEMINAAVKGEKKARLATKLFNSLSAGNEGEALKIAEEFYGDMK